MGLSVNLKTSRGEISNRKLLPGEGVSIYGKATTWNGLFNPGALTTIELINNFGVSVFSDEVYTNLFGDYDSYFVAPFLPGKYEIKVSTTPTISGQDVRVIPIAVGNYDPDPLPLPTPGRSFLEYIPAIALIIGGVYIYKEVIKK